MAGKEDNLTKVESAGVFAVFGAAGLIGGHALLTDWRVAIMASIPVAMCAFGLGIRVGKWLITGRTGG